MLPCIFKCIGSPVRPAGTLKHGREFYHNLLSTHRALPASLVISSSCSRPVLVRSSFVARLQSYIVHRNILPRASSWLPCPPCCTPTLTRDGKWKRKKNNRERSGAHHWSTSSANLILTAFWADTIRGTTRSGISGSALRRR